jgi:hypothetical protein
MLMKPSPSWRLAALPGRLCRQVAHDRADAGVDIGHRGVHHEPIVLPGLIVAVDDVVPCRKRVARDVRLARFDAAPVLDRIGAEDLEIDRDHAGAFRHGTPGGAGEPPWVDAVGNDCPARSEVVLRHCVRDLVSLTFHAIACRAQRLLDRVDPQVHRAHRSRKLPRDGRFADARQSAEDDKHRQA